MNKDSRSPRGPSSGFQFEIRRLGSLTERWVTYQLNRFFDLSIRGGQRRALWGALLLVIFWTVGMGAHIWFAHALPFSLEAGGRVLGLSSQAPLYAVQIMLVMGIAASVALRAAGELLADVFELRDAGVGWSFVRRVAAGDPSETLHLREGKVADGDRDSPMFLIGGPGRVYADADTAAVFERADGTPHVVGPPAQGRRSSDEAGSAVLVDGFERIREPVVDLRDQYIGSAGGEPMTVVGRSLDGMPVSVVDVRGVFSVRRDPNATPAASSTRRGFALRPQDLENLIYGQAVPVLSSGEHASGVPEDWAAAMQTLIRSSLREFMSQNRLTDFLSGVGAQEVETAEYREDTILARSLQVSSDTAGIGVTQPGSQAKMRPRTDLSAKFKKYGSEFSTRAQQLGLELHWIGVGTWKIPEDANGEAVKEKHLEAWRINRENAERSEVFSSREREGRRAPGWQAATDTGGSDIQPSSQSAALLGEGRPD